MLLTFKDPTFTSYCFVNSYNYLLNSISKQKSKHGDMQPQLLTAFLLHFYQSHICEHKHLPAKIVKEESMCILYLHLPSK